MNNAHFSKKLGFYSRAIDQYEIEFMLARFEQLFFDATIPENDVRLCLASCVAILKELKIRNVACKDQSERLFDSYFNLLFDSHQCEDNIISIYADFIINHVFTLRDVRATKFINCLLRGSITPRELFNGWTIEADHMISRDNQQLSIHTFFPHIWRHAIMFAYVQYIHDASSSSDPADSSGILRHLVACIQIETAHKSVLSATSLATLETIMSQETSVILRDSARAALAACPTEAAAPALSRSPGVN